MANLTIRNIDDQVKSRLRINAAHHGISMEEEVRQVLTRAVLAPANNADDADAGNLATRIRATLTSAGLKGVELVMPVREPMREPPTFDAEPLCVSRLARTRASKK